MKTRVIRDERPYIKTAVEKENFFEVSRMNMTTKKMFIVKVEKSVYISFLNSQKKNLSLLKGFTNTEVNFLARNILIGEIRKN